MINLYFANNDKAKIPLVFIHGNSLDMQIFKFQFQSDLTTDFQLVGVDLPGHGKSPRLKVYSFKEIASEVCSLIEKQFEEPYFIVAHSLGGHLITQGLSFLKKVKGLIFCGTPPLGSVNDMPAAFNPGLGQLLYKPTWTNEEFEQLIHDFSPAHPEVVASGLKNSDPVFRKDLISPEFLTDFKNEWSELGKINIPVYLTCAKDDVHINKTYIQEMVQKYSFPDVTYHELSEGGHLPFLNAPEMFNEFLKKTIGQFIL